MGETLESINAPLPNGQLIFDQGAMTSQWRERRGFSTNGPEKTGHPHANLKWIIDLNVKSRTIKPLEGKINKSLCSLGNGTLWEPFWHQRPALL